MERSWYWRLALVVGVVALSIFYTIPSFMYFTAPPEVRRSKEKLKALIPDFLPNKRINLGIDLQGGLHLVMGVDTEKAIQQRTDRTGDELFEEMKEKGATPKSIRRPGEAPELEIVLEKDEDYAKVKEILEGRKDSWEVKSRSGNKISYVMIPEFERRLRDDAVAQGQKTLRNRIDTYGVVEPEVRRRGENSIQIQIAGLTADEERSVKEGIIGKTAQLEFKMVDDENPYFKGLEGKLPEDVKLGYDPYRGPGDALIQAPYLYSKSKESLERVVKENPPPEDRVVRYSQLKGGESGDQWRTWLLDRKTPLTGDALTNAFVAFNSEENHYYVALTFDRRGAVAFEKLSGDNVKKRMAIVLDEIVDSAPVFQQKISGGRASITLGGYKSQQEILEDAKALSIVLNAGALPAPVYPQEERTVGATLGEDAVSKGKAAVIASTILVLGFIFFYYKLSGLVGGVAVFVNMLMLFATLALFQATLTLPGLAGLALTVGMAIDANVIQFERIRDELRLGKTARAAVDAGFDKAFSAIFDSNVTTLIAAIVLFQYGSGPIRGFATTLGIGVLINVFTAVVIPRLIFDYVTRVRRAQTLSI